MNTNEGGIFGSRPQKWRKTMETWYVVNTNTKLVQHEGSLASCELYKRNSEGLWGVKGLVVVNLAGRKDLVGK